MNLETLAQACRIIDSFGNSKDYAGTVFTGKKDKTGKKDGKNTYNRPMGTRRNNLFNPKKPNSIQKTGAADPFVTKLSTMAKTAYADVRKKNYSDAVKECINHMYSRTGLGGGKAKFENAPDLKW